MVDQLTPVPDTPLSGSHRVWFKEPSRKASTPTVGGKVPSEIGVSYIKGEPEQLKEVKSLVYQSGARTVTRLKMSWSTEKLSMVEVVEHSLQVVAEELRKIHKPNISKLKGGYSINFVLILNSWLKDIDMCVCNCNLMEHKAV